MKSDRPLRIVVFGATGAVGRRVAAEALRRGHSVTGVVRDPTGSVHVPPGLVLHEGNASNREDVWRLAQAHDVVVSATRPAPGRETDLVTTARSLLAGLRGTDARLLLVGGAASLQVPGTDGVLAIDDPRFIAPQWHAIARACAQQYAVCRDEHSVAWTYASPPALLEDGERTGAYRRGRDELVLDAQGQSRISYDDFAVAIVDELEARRYVRARFTVGY